MAWLLAVIAAVAATALGIPYLRSASTDVRPIQFSLSPPQNVTLSSAANQTVAVVSPDGRRVAFIANRTGSAPLLWVRSLDTPEDQPLAGTEAATWPFWSPNSRAIGFFTGGKLKTIDAAGGPALSLCDAIAPRGGTWNRDGVIVFAPNATSGLFKISATGGQATPLTSPDASRKENAHVFPTFLPDGRRFLYLVSPSNTIWLGSLDSNEATQLLNADSRAQYVAPGYLVFMRQRTLLAQPFDARHATLTGEAVPIAEPQGSSGWSVSDGAVLAYRTAPLSVRTQLTWFDREGKAIGPIGPPGQYRNPTLSPDGTRLALESSDPQSRTQEPKTFG